MFYYYQAVGGEESWQAVPAAHKMSVTDKIKPMFFTVLSVSKLVEDLPYEEKLKLTYSGPLYFDWDSEDEELVITKVQQFMDKLEDLRVDLNMCYFYATGGRGYHLEIPAALFMERVPKTGVLNLAAIYREMALELCVDTLDLRVYSQGRGRMWRQPNVERSNGRFKVSITAQEMRNMTPELCRQLTKDPRQQMPVRESEFCVQLSIMYSKAQQKVDELAKRRSKIKPDPNAREKAYCESIQWMMSGLGIKAGIGFQEISTQLAISATAAGLNEQDFITACAGLINGHVGDGNRYNTVGKREEELRRMHRYMDGNMCYEFSIGAIKRLLTHSAPDLDGIQVSKDEVLEGIKEAEDEADETADNELDEYGDVAKGITLSRFGVYADTEYGKKRVCAISFMQVSVLKSAETDQIVGYEADILVNGRRVGRQTLEIDVFSGLVPFGRFTARYGHAFQGTDAQVRMVMMRFVEQAKKKGKIQYIVKREGLDVVCITNHENPVLRTPFLIWADAGAVIVEPKIEETGISLAFAGFPDARGLFRTDVREALNLADFVADPTDKAALIDNLKSLITCQRPELLAKLIGWYTSCMWKQLFQRAYGKFPLLHVNGAAGAGKCLAKDTPVLLADGTTKLVQDIVVGDQLLGPDGGVRNVLSLARGSEQMYTIHQVCGEDYTVNASHILSLWDVHRQKVVAMPVLDYVKLSILDRTRFRGWQVPGILSKSGPSRFVKSFQVISAKSVGVGDYYGFTLDGDHLFMLGDFTVTHNTDMTLSIANLFYHLGEPKAQSPGSTAFALQQHLTASASIPLILDEYKPHEMTRDLHNRLKLLMRDVYNQRDVTRGGGNRESEDYRSLQTTQLSAPMVFIAEAAEEESAVMERVVLATVVRPPETQAVRWLQRFQNFRRNKHFLGMIGKYLASEIVHEWSVDKLRDEFDALYDEVKLRFLVTEQDLAGGISEEELQHKRNAKERSVYNHAVAEFGIKQFNRVVRQAVGTVLDEHLLAMEEGIYSRMSDLHSATTPEHVKVLAMLSTMSYHVAPSEREAIRRGFEYDFSSAGGKNLIEIAIKSAYLRYRSYCRLVGVVPLFSGPEAFMYAVKDSPAYVSSGVGSVLQVPGVITFDAGELGRLGVEVFKLSR